MFHISLHYDLIWLSDTSGHAGSIASGLDRVESGLIEQSTVFEKHFNDYSRGFVLQWGPIFWGLIGAASGSLWLPKSIEWHASPAQGDDGNWINT
ncbi:DUF2935 domain-containing protein [Paenibacillus piri]|uniref:DUF2935 domain-containing protein n=1 Tax=Paenibacillus piri TaxID=2547395 RepID=A0A4R5KIX9_9BACL|nr:DUF2935 domain-containing protein [Paenibacillus piri]